MAAGFGRIFGWHCIFIAFGYGNTAFTSEKYRAGGNISKKGHISKTTMMLFAVTLHNIPEE